MAEEATKLGYLDEAITKTVGLECAKKYSSFGSLSSGMNSRSRGRRARELLRWQPSRGGLLDELSEVLHSEWERLSRPM